MITIENDELRVAVAPHYGARVTSLFDKRAGREWLTQGAESRNVGEDARYGSPEAVGWDECFPTVSPYEAEGTPWRRRLRDHGDLWGRAFDVEARTPTSATLGFAAREFRFVRSLTVDGPVLRADYRVDNLGAEPLPYLWALHALLAVDSGDRLELPGVASVRATYLSLNGATIPGGELPWPGLDGRLPFSLDAVQPRSTAFAAKLLLGDTQGSARIGRPGQWLEMAWSTPIRAAGVWITYGGWPQPGGHQEVAIEPTSSAADHLGQAIDAGATPIPAGGRHEWTVTLSVAADATGA
jgi:galactose mutarotase-like enzyme